MPVLKVLNPAEVRSVKIDPVNPVAREQAKVRDSKGERNGELS